jgi:maltooligosyltrehalose trehalohydrolase
MWLRDYHFDGLRLDAVHAIFDFSAHPFLEQLGEEARQLSQQCGRRLVVIPESGLNDPRLLWPRDRGGFGLDAEWNDDFHHALHCVLTGERNGYYEDFGTLADLAKAFTRGYVYDGRYSVHRRRCHGRTPTDLNGQRFLGYAQNHDQVGNRAKGDRLSQIVSPGRLKIAAALVLTSPFVPLLFQGEEWAAGTPFQYFTDHPEPELAKAVREGRRREFVRFGWKPEDIPDPQDPATFSSSKLGWADISRPPHAAMLDWHRRLLKLRYAEPVLLDGSLENVRARFDESARWFVVERGSVTIACNLRDQPQPVPVRQGASRIMLASETGVSLANAEVTLPPDSVAVIT